MKPINMINWIRENEDKIKDAKLQAHAYMLEDKFNNINNDNKLNSLYKELFPESIRINERVKSNG